jgi:hypothetical protein
MSTHTGNRHRCLLRRWSVTALLVMGCGTSADVMRLDSAVRPEKSPEEVQLLLDEPARPYEPIALVDVSDDGNDLGIEALKNRMVKEAAKLGGDAVILVTRGEQEAGDLLLPVGDMWMSFAMAEKKLSGKVIVFSAGKPDKQ